MTDRHERWGLASCQVSSKSIQQLHKKWQKCFSHSKVKVAIVVDGSQNTNMEKDIRATCSCKVSLKSVQLLQIISQKCVGKPESTARQCSFVWQISQKNINFVLTLSNCSLKSYVKICSDCIKRKSKMFQVKGKQVHVYILYFAQGSTWKANVVRNYEYSLHVKFHRNLERRGCLVLILPTPGPAPGMIFPNNKFK